VPIYEYQCEKCGHEFEREQRITEDPVKVCPSCRAKKVRRLISRTAFVLKGGGWYSDLYSSAKPGAESSDKTDAKSEAKSDATTESAAKTETKSESSTSTKSDGSGKKRKSKSAKAA
jgi:putative FmdB family regulatory protein